MTFLFILFSVITVIQVFYILYLAAINIVANRNLLTWKSGIICAVPLVVMVLTDFILNATLATILFLDLPREFMVTTRLARYKDSSWPDGKRKQISLWVCQNWLNPFAPNHKHC